MTTAEQSDPGITADFTPCNEDQGQFLMVVTVLILLFAFLGFIMKWV